MVLDCILRALRVTHPLRYSEDSCTREADGFVLASGSADSYVYGTNNRRTGKRQTASSSGKVAEVKVESSLAHMCREISRDL